jgi:hypothetical protein
VLHAGMISQLNQRSRHTVGLDKDQEQRAEDVKYLRIPLFEWIPAVFRQKDEREKKKSN